MRKFKTRQFKRFADAEDISDDTLQEAVERVAAGHAEVSYGGFLYKVRVARKGGGKSGGYRTLLCVRQGSRAVFLYGFPKSSRSNIDQREERVYKKLSEIWLSRSDDDLSALLKSKDIFEIL